MKLAESTWKQINALDRGTVVVLPTGSCEQHGPHLPVFTDTLLVTAVAERAAENTNALLCPTQWHALSAHHLGFAGTLSAPYDSYMAGLVSSMESLSQHGFWRFLIVNGHGGNVAANELAARMGAEKHPQWQVAHTSYYRFMEKGLARTKRKQIGHACEAETSMMLYLFPELVHIELAVDDGLQRPIEGLVAPFHQLTEHGVLGHARLGNAELGRAMIEEAAEGLTSYIRCLTNGPILLES